MPWSVAATHVTYYATSNRRAPLVKVIGQWPATAGLMRSCQAGVKILCRPATDHEQQMEAESPRHLAYRWLNLETMLLDETEQQGEALGKRLRQAVEEKHGQIDAKLAEARKREEKHERQKAKRRGERPDKEPDSQVAEEMTQPTEQDRRNAEIRAEIAAKQNAEYAEAEMLALGKLGPGYTPWMKLVLLDSNYHRNANTEPAAVVFKVYRGEEQLTENSVYLRKMPDGQVLVADSYEPLFGNLLSENHPTRRLEIKGQMVPAPRWTLCWSALERYVPKTAVVLAALRASRERGKAEREQRKFEEENPLLAWSERQASEGMEGEGTARG
jgi:hypothetical protein